MNRLLKTLKTGAFIAVLGTLALVSCKQKTAQTSTPALEIIPAEASFVVAVNYEDLLKKGNLTAENNYAFLLALRQKLETAPAEIRECIAEFLKNPASSGLDLKTFYVFGIQKDEKIDVFISANIAKQTAFEDNLKKLGISEFVDKGDFKAVEEENKAPVSWNKEIILLAFADAYDYSALYEKKTTIKNVAEFTDAYPAEGDIRFWCRYGSLMNFAALMNPQISLGNFIEEYKNINLSGVLNFANGEIKFDANASPKAEVDKVYEKYPVLKKFDNKLLNDLPEPTFLLLKYAVNPKVFAELLKQTLPDEENPFNAPEVQKVLNALSGDFILDIHGFAEGFIPLPLVSIDFSVNGEEGFKDIQSLLPPTFLAKTGDYYTAMIQMIPVLYAYKDNRVLVTNDATQIQAFVGKSSDKTLKNNETVKKYSSSPNLVYLNLDFSSYPAIIQGLLKNALGEDATTIISVLNRLNSLTFWQTDNYSSAGTFKFADSSTNSLQTLLEIIDTFYKMNARQESFE
jgi:hypothetical protein